MKKAKFTDQQIEDWKRYEKVRKSGKWNMLSPQARAETRLSNERCLFVIDHFYELKQVIEANEC